MSGRSPLRTAATGTIVVILATVVLAADQFTKYLALQNLPLEAAGARHRQLSDLLPHQERRGGVLARQ
ncbi:signal peptidase II [Microbacterium elymi]|uniref:Signal peptidase II n=1 Tax=Microbacterium elymi TaxID=2909587 RepID=A0ABY5NJ67_9MICO|nr:signal peptidase II [Microbacterium elymi]UUT35208.1 signal peptidase II [Microbacterium elymi]